MRMNSINSPEYNLLAIVGPTASGKTRWGARMAERLDGEVISADSRQVYRGLELGAGKDRLDYEVAGRRIPCHLLDVVDLNQEYSVYHFQRDFKEVLRQLRTRYCFPVLVGGSGLYVEAVLKGYTLTPVPENAALRGELNPLSIPSLVERLQSLKPKLHNTTDLQNRERLIRAIEIAAHTPEPSPDPPIELQPLILGLRWPRTVLRQRIADRLQQRLDAGMIAEVEGLLAQGVPGERLLRLGLEYRYIVDFLQGRLANRDELFFKLHLAICDFAKRQETWFRRMERHGTAIQWFDGHDWESAWAWVAGKLRLK